VAVPTPCRRAKAVSWARPVAHDLHGPSCRAGTGTLPAVSCRPWAMLWVVPSAHGPFVHLYIQGVLSQLPWNTWHI
jgi:hypothetical protein